MDQISMGKTIFITLGSVLAGALLIYSALGNIGQGSDTISDALIIVCGFAGLFLIIFGITYPLNRRSQVPEMMRNQVQHRDKNPDRPQDRNKEGLNPLERTKFYYEEGEHYIWPKPGDPSAPSLEEKWK